jgi:DNA-binding winged helix-turn-helix (wHTH) protein
MRDPESVDGEPAKAPSEAEASLLFAGFVLDLGACTLARQSGEPIPLTRGEFALLRVLASRPGRVLSREALLSAVANRNLEPFDRSVDVQIGRLRRKIEPDPKRPAVIVTVPGSGYKFAAELHQAAPALAPEPEKPAAVDAVPRAPERRHVTVLAAELSPAEGRNLPADPEDLRAVIDAFRRRAAEALAQYGSAIGESRGREIVAFFGYPSAHENDAERAVRAALMIQRGLTALGAPNAGNGATELSARI